MLTIVMYHYVRDIAGSPYPGIRGRTLGEFDGQLEYLSRHYVHVSLQDVMDAAGGRMTLPENAYHLTFDDGLSDHYRNVFPRLRERGIPASFYPPTQSALNSVVLEVHKIQFLLSVITDYGALANEIFSMAAAYRSEYEFPSEAGLRAQFVNIRSRFDPPEVVLVKRLLQTGLPGPVRTGVIGELFALHVTTDEAAFAHELYMTMEDMREMYKSGMEFGGHGYRHARMHGMKLDEQEFEIKKSRELMRMLHGREQPWVMNYPFGSYDEETVRLAQKYHAILGLTTKAELVHGFDRPLELERLDTNDLPLSGDAPISRWTAQVLV
ncbi:hypothetical protein C4568_02430 [Candidatus Parcubacteria bacterium]|nr:MAG: hypothetical protein C4568_02430 [Candidatus Parcubacteria bacterium]